MATDGRKYYTYTNLVSSNGSSAAFMTSIGLTDVKLSSNAANTLATTNVNPVVFNRDSSGNYSLMSLRYDGSTVHELEIKKIPTINNVNYFVLGDSVINPINFVPKDEDVPTDRLYSGKSYKLFGKDGNSVQFPSTIVFDDSSAFGGINADPLGGGNFAVFSKLDYFFVPYSTNTSFFESGNCNKFLEKWFLFGKLSYLINGTIKQNLCNTITADSQNCLFLGTECDASGLPSPPSDGSSNNSNRNAVLGAGLAITFVLLLLIFILVLKKK